MRETNETPTPRLALCMIVRDNADTIGRCLETLRPHVDGVFIYDTGSTDGTVELLRRLGEDPALGPLVDAARTAAEQSRKAHKPIDVPRKRLHALAQYVDKLATALGACESDRGNPEKLLAPIVVQEGEWRDDFSWAREQSFAMPDDSFDWIVWADADDVVEGADGFRAVIEACPPEIQGCACEYEYGPTGDEARLRLIRRSAGLRWRGVVHEVLVASNGEPVHAEMLPPEAVRFIHRPVGDDPERNLRRLLSAKERAEANGERPPPRMVSHLALELLDLGRFDDAAEMLGSYLDGDAADAFEHVLIAQALGGLAGGDGEGLQYLNEVLGAADEDGFEWPAATSAGRPRPALRTHR